MLTILRQRNFTLLWVGQAISALGGWILWVGLPFYVYGQTGSALAAGAMFMVRTLPPLLLGSVAGVFVDRWDRRRTLWVVDLLRTLVMLLLLLASFPHWLWVIYPLNFIDAVLNEFFTPAKSALLPRLVGQAHLLEANTLNSLSGDLAMLIGPAVGGILIGLVGFVGVVLLDAISFLVSASLIFLIVLPTDVTEHVRQEVSAYATVWVRTWQDWLAGLQLVQRERSISTLFTVMGIAMFGQGIILVLWAIFVKQVLKGGPLEYGWVQVAVAAGGLCGAALLGRVGTKVSAGRLIGVGGLLTGLLLLATYNLPSLPIILALQFVGGIASVGFFVPLETLLQSSVMDAYRGRIFGAYSTMNALMLLLGQALASVFGDRLGIVSTLNLSGLLYCLSGVVALVLLAKRKHEVLSVQQSEQKVLEETTN